MLRLIKPAFNFLNLKLNLIYLYLLFFMLILINIYNIYSIFKFFIEVLTYFLNLFICILSHLLI